MSVLAERVRRYALEAGREVRAHVESMPATAERATFLEISDRMEKFWNEASDEWLMQWALVAIKAGVR